MDGVESGSGSLPSVQIFHHVDEDARNAPDECVGGLFDARFNGDLGSSIGRLSGDVAPAIFSTAASQSALDLPIRCKKVRTCLYGTKPGSP